MVSFEENELEISIVTYNRCEFIAEWLEHCYAPARERGIHISIYDSSTNDETENYIREFKLENADIEYHRVDPDTAIGYKPMLPLLHSPSKYVWVSGDSRYHDFDYLDKKVFPYLKKDMDYVVIGAGYNNEENDGKIYTDKNEFLRDCFISMTCLGLSIYKTDLFQSLKSNPQLKKECDSKFKDNYAFGWIGYFLKMFSMKETHKAAFSVVPILYIKPDKKVPSWFRRYYHCWVEDLCNLMDRCSEEYQYTEQVIRQTWIYLAHDMPFHCREVREKGDLNAETYRMYKENGMLERVTRHIQRIEKFATLPDKDIQDYLEQEMESERQEFERLCCQRLGEIKERSKGRGLWIYGAGTGGKILLKCLENHAVSVSGFIDQKAKQMNWYEGLPIRSIDEISDQNCYVVISLFYCRPFILSHLMECGLKRKDILYLCIDT